MSEAEMNEAETRAELIDPLIKSAGWGKVDGSRVRREVITLGRLQGAGRRGKPKIADYTLVYRGQKLAVIEAKKHSLPDTEGLGQAKQYATMLQVRFAISTNGDGIYQVDMETGEEGYIDRYPTPDELWEMTFGECEAGEQAWRDRFSVIPFEDRGGQWQPRYYQHNAITKMIDQNEKTLIFCAKQDHALAVRDLVNQMKKSTAPNVTVHFRVAVGRLLEIAENDRENRCDVWKFLWLGSHRLGWPCNRYNCCGLPIGV